MKMVESRQTVLISRKVGKLRTYCSNCLKYVYLDISKELLYTPDPTEIDFRQFSYKLTPLKAKIYEKEDTKYVVPKFAVDGMKDQEKVKMISGIGRLASNRFLLIQNFFHTLYQYQCWKLR